MLKNFNRKNRLFRKITSEMKNQFKCTDNKDCTIYRKYVGDSILEYEIPLQILDVFHNKESFYVAKMLFFVMRTTKNMNGWKVIKYKELVEIYNLIKNES